MTYHDQVTNPDKIANERGALITRIVIFLMLLISAQPAIGASSGFVVITPKNDADHLFLVEVRPETTQPDRTRIRVTWPLDEEKRAWLVVCDKSLLEDEQNFRTILWGVNHELECAIGIRQFSQRHTTLPESGSVRYAYVELTLPDEKMARSYLYIDFPQAIDDGGPYYSVDLGYYLDGPLGKKSEIHWEN